MVRETIEDLRDNHPILSIKALGEYRRNGVVVRTTKANTGFIYDRELILSDGTSIIAWL